MVFGLCAFLLLIELTLIMAQGNGIGALNGIVGFQNCGACRFLFSIDGAFDLHGAEAVLVGMATGFDALDVVGVSLLPLLKISNLLWEVMDNRVFQGIPLAQVVRFQELQTGYLNVQIHLLLDVGISRAQSLDLGIGQRMLVNVLRRPNRAFARHDLPDELLFALHQLIQVAVEGVLRHVGIDLNLRILVTLTDQSSFTLL